MPRFLVSYDVHGQGRVSGVIQADSAEEAIRICEEKAVGMNVEVLREFPNEEGK